MKKLYILSTALGVALLALSACGEDDGDYQPGNPVSEDCIKAYFPSSNESEFIKADEDEKSVRVTVCRENAQSAVTIPLIVNSKTDNVTVPQSVEFAAGETEAGFDVIYANLDQTPKFDISLPEEYTDPYTIKDGSIEYTASVFRLTQISDSVVYRPYDEGVDFVLWQNEISSIYQMGNENIFIWRNFYGSGLDLKFQVDGTFDSSNVYKTKGNVIPLNHYYSDGVYGWYFTTNADGTGYESWTPKGQSTVVDWLYFYDEYEGSSYFYIDFEPIVGKTKAYGWGYAWSALVNAYNNYVSNYVYMYYNRSDFDDDGNYIGKK